MRREDFEEFLALGYERPGVEFKGPGVRTDKAFLANVVRAMLGMANRRDGGVVILGVVEMSGKLSTVGLSPSDLATWRYDDVASAVSEYFDPYLTFTLEVLTHDDRQFVVLNIGEFSDIPVL